MDAIADCLDASLMGFVSSGFEGFDSDAADDEEVVASSFDSLTKSTFSAGTALLSWYAPNIDARRSEVDFDSASLT
jgi:hypothetical protein